MALLILVSEWGKRSNMKKDENKDFDLVNLPEAAQDPEIKQEDFTLLQADKAIHEQRFQTKPTTFFKDSLKRFSKNKSSVVAAYILGILVLLAIFVPIFNKNDVSNAANAALINLEPKLFESGTGFWDGTVKVTHKEVDPNNNYYPDPTIYYESGVKDLSKPVEDFTNVPNRFGKGGYVETGFYGGYNIEESYLSSVNPAILNTEYKFTLDLTSSSLRLTNFVVADEAMLNDDLGKDGVVPENFKLGLTGLDFVYLNGDEEKSIELVAPDSVQTIGMDGGDPEVDLTSLILANEDGLTSFSNFYFRFVTAKPLDASGEDHICSLIKSMVIETTSDNKNEQLYFSSTTDELTLLDGMSFTDAMQMMVRSYEVGSGSKLLKNMGYWNIDNINRNLKQIYLAKAYFANFTYDSYEATLGARTWYIDNFDIEKWQSNGWISYNIDILFDSHNNPYVDPLTFEFEILNKSKCPLIETINAEDITVTGIIGGDVTLLIKARVMYYKYLGYDTMPKFLFGTDKTGRDMFKYVFEGLRNSLLLGVFTFIVCFIFGLIYGAVSGYFGGTVDLVMERVTDILSGVPWIVVMTIVILKAGSSFGTFALALCLTGWIGTAATTRTQFYRFRGREYVLASRTLGASDARLIFKHILPNALGTIITGAVLMIPSVIFSEATISYLGLGFKNLSSLGVILSNNQSELTNHPYQLIFPSVVIALVMISFNLFGNGLRDAINPSLKGEEN